jgi:N-acetyl-anhydromuramyl-L-alanine amidase AmpD
MSKSNLKHSSLIIALLSAALLYKLYKLAFKRPKIFNIIDKLPSDGAYKKRKAEQIKGATYHHTGVTSKQTTENIARYHVFNNGWPGIGYHYVISPDGKIEQTQSDLSVSYHNGYNNTGYIGISCKGNFNNDQITDKQYDSMISLCNYLKGKYKNFKFLVGHKEYPTARTSCPGKYSRIEEIRRRTGLINPYSEVKKGGSIPASYSASYRTYNPSEADN